jgi:hypothetical protein
MLQKTLTFAEANATRSSTMDKNRSIKEVELQHFLAQAETDANTLAGLDTAYFAGDTALTYGAVQRAVAAGRLDPKYLVSGDPAATHLLVAEEIQKILKDA